MAHIKSRKNHYKTSLVALAATLPLIAHADNTTNEGVIQLPEITVKNKTVSEYKVDQLSSVKSSQALVDTPQTVSIINKNLLKEQGATTLVEALRNTPGITLQLGENGNTSAGDAFQMRGFSTQSSTYLDGIRDLGAVNRDVFNLEQVEVVKGPAGAEGGRGTASGYVNLVSKLPHLENSREVSATYNTAEHTRLATDINQAINDSIAIRLNAMGQDGGVQGRDYIENQGWAIAPSIAFGLDSDTRLYLYSQHIRQRNIPDGGIPTIGMKGFWNADPLISNAAKVDRENYYGHADDHEDINADMFTAKIESDWAENLKFTNITRLGNTQMQRTLTGINTISRNDSTNPQDWTVSRSRQGVDQKNKILANQSTINWNVKTGSVEHDVVAGVELLKEQQYSKTLATQMPGQPSNSTPPANLYHPDRYQNLPDPVYTGAYSDGETQTAAAYLFDTLKFGERFQLNGGVRIDYYDTNYDALGYSTDSNTLAVTETRTDLKAHDTLFSWKLGGLYKPTAYSSVYASYAKSLTPPGSNNFSLSTTGANSSAADPQETHHYEIGTKWDLLEGNLALNAAVYHTENENQFTQDPITRESIQEGKTVVKGVELGAVGKITDAWNISAGVAHMKTEQKDQLSVNANTGAITQTNSVRWSPEWTASLWTTYNISGLKLGLGARYVDEQKRVITDSTATANMPSIPGYVVFDAMAGYTFNDRASLNLNVYNLTDKEYISTLNNGGGRMILGQPRSAALTLNYKF